MITKSLISGLCLLIVASFLGCSGGKESLHEDDHTMPPHWPVNLSDAAGKIEQRFEQLSKDPKSAQANNPTFEEFRDLIEWAPLVAADRELSEQQWNPIYELSENVRKQLRAFGNGDSVKSHVESLCKTLRDNHAIVDAIEKSLAIVVAEEIEPSPSPQNPTVEVEDQ